MKRITRREFVRFAAEGYLRPANVTIAKVLRKHGCENVTVEPFETAAIGSMNSQRPASPTMPMGCMMFGLRGVSHA